MSKIVVIDPGHGGHDPGAVANGLREKDLVLDISKRTKKYLENNYNGVKVYLTRTNDKFLTLSARAKFANDKKADLFVSMHINAGGGTGYESFIYSSPSSNTVKLQNSVHDEAMKEMKVTNRGKKRANFAVLRLTKMPAILPENLFIDRKADANKLKDSKFLDKVAKGHAIGIAKFLGLKKKASRTSSSSKTSTTKKTSSNTASKTNTKTSNTKTSATKSTYTGSSVVDYLKSINQPSDFNSRKKLAEQLGIKGYKGTESQNIQLLKLLRDGKGSTTKTSSKANTSKKTSSNSSKTYKVGDRVLLKRTATRYATGQRIPARYRGRTFTIQQVAAGKVLLKELYSWVRTKDIQ